MTDQGAMPAYPEWRAIVSAPISDPLNQQWFLAYCPDDSWGVMGCVHVACRYGYLPAGLVRVLGSNNDRRATHWTPTPEPPALSDQPTRQEGA